MEGGRKEKGKEKNKKKKGKERKGQLEAEITEQRIQLLLRAGKHCLEFQKYSIEERKKKKERKKKQSHKNYKIYIYEVCFKK